MIEQQYTRDETETADVDVVGTVPHTTKQGRNEVSCFAGVLASQDAEEHILHQRDFHAAAHARVMEDWSGDVTEQRPQIRFEVWNASFLQTEPANEVERRFLKTCCIRERTIRWTRGDDS